MSFGDPKRRNWDDDRRFGYICAGGGSWYSQTLKMLSPGDRVWVKILQVGDLGVGVVTDAVQAANQFTVPTPQGERLAMDLVQQGAFYRETANDPEVSEYFVWARWLDTVDVEHPFNELGLFGNQNTDCQPRTPKWRHTVERLKRVFKDWDA